MNTALKLRKIGNSVGVLLSREVLNSLQVKEGDSIYLTETEDFGYRLTKFDPEFADKLQRADNIMNRYPDALKELAK